ncbi:box C/D snoRNA protein 1 isoform X2 [Pipistrellus kuhlii]|uniref:Box C/D snoRNA protein 1 n=1 Tax=Pipistrellus kuhlii TaxID=59472 RepID=A0A7J8ACN5_PIPKU|nr:box C/D snoRNA protein 1 isoform X2 [Pipistrellus kuhlii]KAF6384272.1 zinc finger HIT-type containing 6 [Pipistrellus kuhlii]
MDFAADNETTSGGGLRRGAEGARLPLEAGGGAAAKGLTGAEQTAGGEEGTAPGAGEETRAFPAAVKLENTDWPETEGGMLEGRPIKQEAEDGPEVKEEKPDPVEVKLEVKQEAEGGWAVKEEKVEEDGPEIKEEKVEDGPNIKEEKVEDGPEIKKEKVEDGPEIKEEKVEIGPEIKEEKVKDGPEIKEEKVEDGPEIKEEKVKVKEEVMDWPDVKEEGKDHLEIKQEEEMVLFTQNIKEEVMDEACVKEEKCFLKEEILEDTKVKEEPPINCPVGSKRKLAMTRCETCGTEEAKYRCPRCMRHSCSLPCVKKHKAELTCNGVRDKTAYVSLQQFTEMDLLSDYRFLEDVARTADHISRDALLKRSLSNKHMCFMKNRARRQGINLKLLPNGFTKRKENSTFFDKKKQQFCWHVKLQFPQSQAVYIEKRVPDNKTINEILATYIDPEKSDPVIRQRLKAYIRSQTGVQILMKVENMQQNLVRYYELDPHKSLLDNLRDKVIIEYPTLHVVLKESSKDMNILHEVKSESTKNIGNEN